MAVEQERTSSSRARLYGEPPEHVLQKVIPDQNAFSFAGDHEGEQDPCGFCYKIKHSISPDILEAGVRENLAGAPSTGAEEDSTVDNKKNLVPDNLSGIRRKISLSRIWKRSTQKEKIRQDQPADENDPPKTSSKPPPEDKTKDDTRVLPRTEPPFTLSTVLTELEKENIRTIMHVLVTPMEHCTYERIFERLLQAENNTIRGVRAEHILNMTVQTARELIHQNGKQAPCPFFPVHVQFNLMRQQTFSTMRAIIGSLTHRAATAGPDEKDRIIVLLLDCCHKLYNDVNKNRVGAAAVERAEDIAAEIQEANSELAKRNKELEQEIFEMRQAFAAGNSPPERRSSSYDRALERASMLGKFYRRNLLIQRDLYLMDEKNRRDNYSTDPVLDADLRSKANAEEWRLAVSISADHEFTYLRKCPKMNIRTFVRIQFLPALALYMSSAGDLDWPDVRKKRSLYSKLNYDLHTQVEMHRGYRRVSDPDTTFDEFITYLDRKEEEMAKNPDVINGIDRTHTCALCCDMRHTEPECWKLKAYGRGPLWQGQNINPDNMDVDHHSLVDTLAAFTDQPEAKDIGSDKDQGQKEQDKEPQLIDFDETGDATLEAPHHDE